MYKYKLGIIGCGNMSQAIIRGLNSGNLYDFLNDANAALEIIVSDVNAEQLDKISACKYKNLTVTTDNNILVNSSDYVFLAIKPQSAEGVLKNLRLENKIIISIMAGVSTDKISALTGSKKVARLMPNLNAKINGSLTAYTLKNINECEKAFILALTASFGSSVQIDEKDFPAFTGIAGSGPAFVFMFVKAFVTSASEYGFNDDDAIRMAVNIIETSARHTENIKNADDLTNLIDSVCSKGGTTIEGVNFLTEKGFTDIVKTAISRSADKAYKMEADNE